MEAQLLVFVTASIVVILTPGQDMLLVLSRALAQGAKAGIVTAAGVSLGLLGHTALTAFGLGTLLLASEKLFTVLKYLGALYLFYLGFKLMVNRPGDLQLEQDNGASLGRLFATGVFSNLSNPKITIFYLAFLPQFIPTNCVDPAGRLAFFGFFFSMLTFLIKGPLGYLAGQLSSWIRSRPEVLTVMNRISATVLIALGIRLAFGSRN